MFIELIFSIFLSKKCNKVYRNKYKSNTNFWNHVSSFKENDYRTLNSACLECVSYSSNQLQIQSVFNTHIRIHRAFPGCICECTEHGIGPGVLWTANTLDRAWHICLLFSQLQLKFFAWPSLTRFGAKIIAKPICGNYLMCSPRWGLRT